MSLEAWGDEGADDYGADRLLDAGWLCADDAEQLVDAARKWIRLRRRLDYSHNSYVEEAAANELVAAFENVFGKPFMILEPGQ